MLIDKKIKTIAIRLSHIENEMLQDLIHFYSSHGVKVSISAIIHKLVHDDRERLIKEGSLTL